MDLPYQFGHGMGIHVENHPFFHSERLSLYCVPVVPSNLNFPLNLMLAPSARGIGCGLRFISLTVMGVLPPVKSERKHGQKRIIFNFLLVKAECRPASFVGVLRRLASDSKPIKGI